ncbi:MAG: rRNA maturation RNase YbeY [Candidatus Izemoplasmatales bacterium]
MIKINIFNQYDNEKEYNKTIKKAIKTAYKYLKFNQKIIINVVLVNDEEIHTMNLNYRKIDRPTDVLSFENEDYTDEIGDIFISIDKTKEQALSYNHSFERELAFLSVHGFLHCLGYDHLDKEDEKEMFEIQDEILEISKFRRTK